MAKILIVEDRQVIARIYELVLQADGYELIFAYNAAEGLRLFNAHGPHLVISDVNLPDSSGLDLLQEIKTFSDVPFIVITGGSTPEANLEKATAMGAVGVFQKPIAGPALLSAVRNALKAPEVAA